MVVACGTRDMDCRKATGITGTEPWVACKPASSGSIKLKR